MGAPACACNAINFLNPARIPGSQNRQLGQLSPGGSWFPTLSPDHPSDEVLSPGTPVRRKDGARRHFGKLAPAHFFMARNAPKARLAPPPLLPSQVAEGVRLESLP